MSVSAQIAFTATTTEVLEGNPNSSSPANRTITHSLFNVAKQLDANSDPAAHETANFIKVGDSNIDLTQLIAANGVILDGTGRRVLYVRITNLSGNEMTIQNGAANGHEFWGTGEVPVGAGGTVGFYTPADAQVIDSAHRIWTVTDGGSDVGQYQFTVILGAVEE